MSPDPGTADVTGLTKLGHHTAFRYDDPDASMLEAFPNQNPGADWVVGLDCLEFTSLCPMTGQPDFGRIHVHYIPGPRCVESKSMKLYLGAFRNHGAFHEDCVNRIADDLCSVLTPRYLRVFGDFRPRGGIAIRPLAVRHAADLGDDERARCLELLAHHDALARHPSIQ
ncbi:MAG: preQ(1) synthase [Acidimicrobiales bacterium]|nr:preQ(1) synthase [Acidimicrobiales bacterium]